MTSGTQGTDAGDRKLLVCPHFYPYELQVRTYLLNQMALLDCLLSDQKIMILTLILPMHTLPKEKLC